MPEDNRNGAAAGFQVALAGDNAADPVFAVIGDPFGEIAAALEANNGVAAGGFLANLEETQSLPTESR